MCERQGSKSALQSVKTLISTKSGRSRVSDDHQLPFIAVKDEADQ